MPENEEERADAAEKREVTRKTLQRLEMPDGRELVLAEVTYPPAGAAPAHRHPVPGIV